MPSILANITVPLVGLVDTAVAGHLHSTAGTSAEFIGAKMQDGVLTITLPKKMEQKQIPAKRQIQIG